MARNHDRNNIMDVLAHRIGADAVQRRLDLEQDFERRLLGGTFNTTDPKNWRATRTLLMLGLKVFGLYQRGYRNASNVQLRHNVVASSSLPLAFNNFRILHLSDLHVDASPLAMERVIDLIKQFSYDLCVMTGDYRGASTGPHDACVGGIKELRRHIATEIYAVLGNHDSIHMVPEIEAMGIRILLNEAMTIARDDSRLHLVGVDEAQYYRGHDIAKAAKAVPRVDYTILLSHTPEIYREAEEAGFNLMLSGHTHGGQICLPGGIPITLDSNLPRRFGAGAWQYRGLTGYTSVGAGTSMVPVRYNCAPEITLHELRLA